MFIEFSKYLIGSQLNSVSENFGPLAEMKNKITETNAKKNKKQKKNRKINKKNPDKIG